jgi:CHAT domain-containing protein
MLLISPWKVLDNQTSQIMEIFYVRLHEVFECSEALHQAQFVVLMFHTKQIVCWGAFICHGDPRSPWLTLQLLDAEEL